MSPIRRQHEATVMSEIEGAVCAEFLAVVGSNETLRLLYIVLNGAWHRFYLDAGLLFWAEGEEPDPEDELLEDEVFVDLAEKLRCKGDAVRDVTFGNGTLRMEFARGSRLRLHDGVRDDCGGTVEEMVPGEE